ncbi:Uncharacterised protein [Vibrio cholerae]|nr:Uncharacterised protein [Vibrio cholerae]CSA96028.1 Uncharacterised protein [Vibrio cholerae]CSC10378.1 Uncharacterised protein [Vibrio cholerae]
MAIFRSKHFCQFNRLVNHHFVWYVFTTRHFIHGQTQ